MVAEIYGVDLAQSKVLRYKCFEAENLPFSKSLIQQKPEDQN